jgi:hypothetical protein
MTQSSDDRHIEDLLLHWEEARACGLPRDVADLCPDRPDLAREVARRVAALLRVGAALDRDVPTPGTCSTWQALSERITRSR